MRAIKIPNIMNKPFRNFGQADADVYLNWYINLMPERLAYLKEQLAIKEFKYEERELVLLYDWFSSKVRSRKRSIVEKEELELQVATTPLLAKVIDADKEILDEDTAIACFDTAIFFGSYLKIHIKDLHWTFRLKPKNYIDFGQPILERKEGSTVPLNPRRVMEMQAYKILDNNIDHNSFVKLYDIWSNMRSK